MKRTLLAAILLVATAAPALAEDFPACWSVELDWTTGMPVVTNSNGDSEALTWTLEGTVITWNVGEPHTIDASIVMVTACEDGTVFFQGPPAEGGEGPAESVTVTPAEPETSETPQDASETLAEPVLVTLLPEFQVV